MLKRLFCGAVKVVKLLYSAELFLKIFSISLATVLTKALLNGLVSDFVPSVIEDETFSILISFYNLFYEESGAVLHLGVSEAGLPTAKKRSV